MNTRNIRSREQLIKAISAGESFRYLYFWGHQPAAEGAVTASCLSQWYAAPFQVDGRIFPSAEHYMMARKAELFGQPRLAADILSTPDPGKAKALGRTVQRFSNEVWIRHRWDIVVAGNTYKFSQNPALSAFLLGTGARVLVEASPVDDIWGIGLDARAAGASNPMRWKGLNLLGFALMEVRAALMTGSAIQP